MSSCVEKLYGDAASRSRLDWLESIHVDIQNLIKEIKTQAFTMHGISPAAYDSLKDRAKPFMLLRDPRLYTYKKELLDILKLAKTQLRTDPDRSTIERRSDHKESVIPETKESLPPPDSVESKTVKHCCC